MTTIVVVLLLATLVGSALLWVCSYRLRVTVKRDSVPRQGVGNTLLLEANRGLLLFQDLRYGPYRGERTVTYSLERERSRPDAGVYGVWSRMANQRHGTHRTIGWQSIGFRWSEYLGQTAQVIALPFWLICLLCGAVPAIVVWRATTTRRRALAGRCPTCGYDLRASPGRCPECGARPADPAAA